MLVLTSYYSEVRQHLEWGKRHGHLVDMHCSSLTQHEEKLTWLTVCGCACSLYVLIALSFLYICPCDGGVCDRENGISSRRSDLTADRLWRRDGGATSAAQLRGNPWHGVSY